MFDFTIQNADGLGWRWEKADGSLSVLFKVEGEESAGARVKIAAGIVELPPIEKIEKTIALFQKEGFAEAGILGNKLTPITWATYLEEFGGD